MPRSPAYWQRARQGDTAAPTGHGGAGSGTSASRGLFSMATLASGGSPRGRSAPSRANAEDLHRAPSREHFLTPEALASLPAELAPNVPVHQQQMPVQSRLAANRQGRPVAGLSGQGREGAPIVGGVADSPSNPFSSLRYALASSQDEVAAQAGDGAETDGEGEWETVASGFGPAASSLAPPSYRPRFQQAGSSLADNSSLGGLTLPGEPRQGRSTARFQPLASSSPRSYTHPSGAPAGHPLANVPCLRAGPGPSMEREREGTRGEFVGAPREGLRAFSRHGADAVTEEDNWEDITAELGRPEPAAVVPSRTRSAWRRNVRRAVARHPSPSAADGPVPAASRRPMVATSWTRPGRPVSTNTTVPPHSAQRQFAAATRYDEEAAIGFPAAPPIALQHLGYSEFETGTDMSSWDGYNSSAPTLRMQRTSHAAYWPYHAAAWCRSLLRSRLSVGIYAIIATIVIVVLAVIISASRRH